VCVQGFCHEYSCAMEASAWRSCKVSR
jgi:hypothetical protein